MLGKWTKSRHVVVQSMGFTPLSGNFTWNTQATSGGFVPWKYRATFSPFLTQ